MLYWQLWQIYYLFVEEHLTIIYILGNVYYNNMHLVNTMIWVLFVVIVIIITIIALNLYQRYVVDMMKVNNKQRQIALVLQELYKNINDVCYRSDTAITYRLIVDEVMSFVENSEDKRGDVYNIHLVVWNEQYKRPYDLNSLLFVVLSELSALTGQPKLLLIAQQLGYYDVTMPIEHMPINRIIQ